MDVMGCDGNLDYPQNHYFIESDPFEMEVQTNGSSTNLIFVVIGC